MKIHSSGFSGSSALSLAGRRLLVSSASQLMRLLKMRTWTLFLMSWLCHSGTNFGISTSRYIRASSRDMIPITRNFTKQWVRISSSQLAFAEGFSSTLWLIRVLRIEARSSSCLTLTRKTTSLVGFGRSALLRLRLKCFFPRLAS